MNARETIARHLCKRAGQGWSGISPYERGVYRTRAHNILADVDAAGFTIMSKEDVEAVRDKALEEAAAMCEKPRRFHDGSEITMPSGMAYAAAIRSLKSSDAPSAKDQAKEAADAALRAARGASHAD